MYLEKINSPQDLKTLSIDELSVLSDEIRQTLIKRLSEFGGHIGPNLGVVELTVALHYVFNSPVDKIVFDVSHQSYTHKILTGRKVAFMDKNHYRDVSGFTNPRESEHDFFRVGHTSTSISLASGLAIARDRKGGKENIIAFIGDGSLSGGEALEALDNAGEYKNNLIIILNDNQMSIPENHGGLYKNLQLLRESKGANPFNFFKVLGLDYLYIEDGHNIPLLVDKLNSIKDIDHPIVVHVNTIKGKGLKFAEEHQEMWHAGGPFNPETGERNRPYLIETPSELSYQHLSKKMREDKDIFVVMSSTPLVLNFTPERRKEFKDQFIDVDICEEHAMGLISGMARGGIKPVYGIFASFIQRTYDQILQDICLNNSPVTIIVDGGSICGGNDETHLGIFDISMLTNIPNLIYLAPTSIEEYFAMVDYSIDQNKHPIAIRMPISITHNLYPFDSDYSDINKFQVVEKGSKIALIGVGNSFILTKEVFELLKKENINATLINPRFISGLDEPLLNELKKEHQIVVTIEDGILSGGFGQKVSSYFGNSGVRVLNYGVKKQFYDQFKLDDVLNDCHLKKELISEDVIKLLEEMNNGK